MTIQRTGSAFLALGCFLLGGLAVVLQAFGSSPLAQERVTNLVAAGLMAIVVGVALAPAVSRAAAPGLRHVRPATPGR